MAMAGLMWPLPAGVDEEELERRLFAQEPAVRGRDQARPLPDWEVVRKELSGEGVTLRLLWEEYRQAHPDGYEYSQFCEHYRRWLRPAGYGETRRRRRSSRRSAVGGSKRVLA